MGRSVLHSDRVTTNPTWGHETSNNNGIGGLNVLSPSSSFLLLHLSVSLFSLNNNTSGTDPPKLHQSPYQFSPFFYY
ncbi:hypothetical protein RIF29_11701 [Crotalaria pallida]|uniref:Uncharacterized protein n=1 Tax=Crotalaria pallida TaxID=3830 RepID=A0AAN9IMD7_CROPI